jgi:hypothetical protein
MRTKYTKKRRIKHYTKLQKREDFAEGYKNSAQVRTAMAKKMHGYEAEAARTGKTVSQVIAEAIG